MTRRYYVPGLPPEGGLVELEPAEAQHAARVMRVQPGQRVTLFDGLGHEAEAEVVHVDRRACHCRSEAMSVVDREPLRRLSLAVALPKPERAKELVERLTELGVDRLIPLETERTQRPPSRNLLEKLRRVVVEACKQSGRNRLMEVTPPVTLSALVAEQDGSSKWILDLHGEPASGAELTGVERAIVLVGPEGGWTDEERSAATAADFRPLCLGPRVYRIETAAAAIAARWLD